MRVLIAQINSTIGALSANAELIRRAYGDGVRAGADVVMVPELSVTGYPPRDLLDRERFIDATLAIRDELAAMTSATTLIFGCPIRSVSWCGKRLHNAAVVARHGKIILEQAKTLLPTYDVFDELRYFEPGSTVQLVEIAGRRAGVVICEDFWFDDEVAGKKLYCRNVVDDLARQGAEVFLNISASPFNAGKRRTRLEIFSRIAKRYDAPLVYVNQIGGNDELLFDGSSIVFDAAGKTIFCAPAFEEDRSLVEVPLGRRRASVGRRLAVGGRREYDSAVDDSAVDDSADDDHVLDNIFTADRRPPTADPPATANISTADRQPPTADRLTTAHPDPSDPDKAEEIGRALILGLRDYIRKCGFRDVVIGLSGGIDSALTAAIAVEAVGQEHVTGIAMPSQFSSAHSVEDARRLAENLGVAFHIAPIADIYAPCERAIDALFGEHELDTTNENIQARIRGNILMAWSNRTGAMVVSTGNKSELAVGYCTLYGDMAGGLALLGDVYKTMVYRISHWINREREIIPRSTLTKPPSAELRPNQTDQDTLPPYEVLDGILKLYIEEWKEVDEIVAAGFDRALVERILRMVDTAEFKRRQAAPTIRVSTKAFGSGRDMPIAQRWRREPARDVR